MTTCRNCERELTPLNTPICTQCGALVTSNIVNSNIVNVGVKTQPQPTGWVNIDSTGVVSAEAFLRRLASVRGSKIVSSGSMATVDIAHAQACGRFFVLEDGLGFAFIPPAPEVSTANSVTSP
jgi:hypothetical protein